MMKTASTAMTTTMTVDDDYGDDDDDDSDLAPSNSPLLTNMKNQLFKFRAGFKQLILL